MPDFIIVLVAAAATALAPPGGAAPGTSPASPASAFRTYADAEGCERAAAAMPAPGGGARRVCLPCEAAAGDLPSTH